MRSATTVLIVAVMIVLCVVAILGAFYGLLWLLTEPLA